MESIVQNHPYNPIRVRNVPQYMADTQRERGIALSLEEWVGLGLTADQAKRNADAAARLFALADA